MKKLDDRSQIACKTSDWKFRCRSPPLGRMIEFRNEIYYSVYLPGTPFPVAEPPTYSRVLEYSGDLLPVTYLAPRFASITRQKCSITLIRFDTKPIHSTKYTFLWNKKQRNRQNGDELLKSNNGLGAQNFLRKMTYQILNKFGKNKVEEESLKRKNNKLGGNVIFTQQAYVKRLDNQKVSSAVFCRTNSIFLQTFCAHKASQRPSLTKNPGVKMRRYSPTMLQQERVHKNGV